MKEAMVEFIWMVAFFFVLAGALNFGVQVIRLLFLNGLQAINDILRYQEAIKRTENGRKD